MMALLMIAAMSSITCGGESTSPDVAPVARVELAPNEVTIGVGSTMPLDVSVRGADGTPVSVNEVFWSSSDSTVARVSDRGIVTAVGPGTATIAATVQGRSGTVTVNVSPLPATAATITVSPSSVSMTDGQSVQLVATVRDADGRTLGGRTVTWSTTTPNIVSVSATGQVVGVQVGTGSVTVSTEGRVTTVPVTVVQRPVGSVVVTPSQLSLVAGQAATLVVQVTDGNGQLLTGRPVSFASTNAAVARVSDNGVVTAVATGNATIQVTSEGRSVNVPVSVGAQPVSSVQVTPGTASVTVGGTVSLSATALDASGGTLSGRPVIWSSGAPSVATVSASGVVTGIAGGTAVILASIDGRVGSSTITVSVPSPVPVASVTVSPSSVSTTEGQSVQLVATARGANGQTLTGRTVTWSTNAPSIVSISASGQLVGLRAGSASVIASVEGRTATVPVTVSALAPRVTRIEVTPRESSILFQGPTRRTVQLTAVAYAANGERVNGVTFTWTSSNTRVATVSSSGLVSGMGEGEVTITASADGVNGRAEVEVERR
jgi:trimeric autotransporter adhesin